MIMMTWFVVALQFSSVALAIVGGVFLAFSDFLMRSLDRAGPVAGIGAMQAINREVIRSVFVSLLMLLAATSPLMMGYALFRLHGLSLVLTVAGGAIYLLGAFAVTVVFNIPKNNRLDRGAADDGDHQAYWRDVYLTRWTAWNHVRTAACLVAAGCYAGAAIGLVAFPH